MTDDAKTITGMLGICVGVLIFIADIFIALAVNSLSHYAVTVIGAVGVTSIGVIMLTWLVFGNVVIRVFMLALICASTHPFLRNFPLFTREDGTPVSIRNVINFMSSFGKHNVKVAYHGRR